MVPVRFDASQTRAYSLAIHFSCIVFIPVINWMPPRPLCLHIVQQQATQLILKSQLESTTLGTWKKRKTTLPLAIVACLCSRHILWQYFDSYLLEVRKKRKVKGCRGEGGLKKRICQKGIPSLSNGGLGLGIPPLTLFRGHTRPGASVQLALLLPRSSWTPLGFSSPSSAALWRSGGGLGCWKRPGERRRWQQRRKGKLKQVNCFAS